MRMRMIYRVLCRRGGYWWEPQRGVNRFGSEPAAERRAIELLAATGTTTCVVASIERAWTAA